jgi:hypothetical protein
MDKIFRERLLALFEEYGEAQYARGKAEGVAEFTRSLNNFFGRDVFSVPVLPPKPKSDDIRPGCGMAIVLETIRNNPGLFGNQIVNKVQPLVKERTARTALFRLFHDKQLIFKKGHQWYAKDAEKWRSR